MEKYATWIEEHVPEDCQGLCIKTSKKMAEAFPELKKVKGTVRFIGKFGTEHTATHHWCETEDGEVVDPTAGQFRVILSYKRIDGNITGKCPNYSEYCFNGAALCSDKCSKEYAEYLKKPIRGLS